MQRETKEIVTTSGKKVTIYSYLTGRENNEIKKILFKSVSIDSDNVVPGEKPKVGRIPLSVAIERQEKIIEVSVIKFEGSEVNAADKVKDLPSDEYDDLVKKIETELNINFQKAM